MIPAAALRLALAAAAALPLAGAERPVRPLAHEAYLWQRHWTPALRAAIRGSADLVGAFRVQAARADARGRLKPVAVDWAALAASGRPAVAVVRIEGQLARFDEAALLDDLAAFAAALPRGSTPILGLEIDHDCATARLPAYGRFLGRLRAALDGAPDRPRLSVTALPAWTASPHLAGVLAPVDEAVLQVHAVLSPAHGLFDGARAADWVRAFAARSPKPFRVALPAYGARVGFRADGRIASVESEAPLLAGGEAPVELAAAPQEVAGFLRVLEREALPRLAGVVWFRLPTGADRRAWGLETWRAVVRGADLRPAVAIRLRPSGIPGTRDVVLVNGGALDGSLPATVDLPPGCAAADGVAGYALDRTGPDPILRRLQPGILRGGAERAIGWTRCAAEAEPDARS
jgi:Protein of unknown function (DUF3142)